MKDNEIRDIILKETIILVFSVASVIIAAKLMGHDVLRPVKMKALLALKRGSQSQADAWQKLANTAATTYHKANL